MGWEACRNIYEVGKRFVQEETRKYVKLIGMASTMGISMVLALVIAIVIGYYLDKWLKTSPCSFLFS